MVLKRKSARQIDIGPDRELAGEQVTSTYDAVILVFAKAPVAGRVKTRLGRVLGDDEAAAWAGAFLADTWSSVARTPRARPVLALSGALDPALLEPPAEVWDQGPGDLGSRLERCLRRALCFASRAVALGADSPGLPTSRVAEALSLLRGGARSVLGPAEDGGFYLLGLDQCPPGLFDQLPLGTAHAGSAMRLRLAERGLAGAELEPWYDVDDARDLQRLEADLRARRIVAPCCAERFRARLQRGTGLGNP